MTTTMTAPAIEEIIIPSMPCNDLPAGYTEEEFEELVEEDPSSAIEALRLPKIVLLTTYVNHAVTRINLKAFMSNLGWLLCGCTIDDTNRWLRKDIQREVEKLFHIGVGVTYDSALDPGEVQHEMDSLGDTAAQAETNYECGEDCDGDGRLRIYYGDAEWHERFRNCFEYETYQRGETIQLVPGSLKLKHPDALLDCFRDFDDMNHPDWDEDSFSAWASSDQLSTRWHFDDETLCEMNGAWVQTKITTFNS